MAKEDLIETTATVTEVLPDARYRVKLDNGYELIAYTNGKMRKHHIRILAGDKVSLEISPYDMTKGRITFRHIEGRPPVAAAGGKRKESIQEKHSANRVLLFCLLDDLNRLIFKLDFLSGADFMTAFGADFFVHIH